MITHVEKLRVRWMDTDASGRIHYTAAFRYFEAAEWELFRRAGISLRDQEKTFGFPRVSVAATFHVPLFADDEVAVHIRAERVGTTSITFALEVFRQETLCISGKVTSVFIDDQGRPLAVPAPIRQAFTTGA